MKARNLTTRRSIGTSSLLVALIALFALAASSGCAVDVQSPEDEAETQTSALVQQQDEQATQFDERESKSDEAELPTGTQSDDPTPVPWHETDPDIASHADDPTPQPWDVQVEDVDHTRSQQTK